MPRVAFSFVLSLFAGILTSTVLSASAAAETALPVTPDADILTLVTGEQIAETGHNGQYQYAPLVGTGKSALHSFRAADGDEYIVPAVAVPFLGHGLDLSLFDVSAMLAQGAGQRIPVNLTFAPGGKPSAPPGVTLTSTTGSTATGYLTRNSAATFGATLGEGIANSEQSGTALNAVPLPNGVAAMSAPSAAQTKQAGPNYSMKLLQINTTDLNGAPAESLVVLQNIDSVDSFSAGVDTSGGIGKIQAPVGDYAAVAYFDNFDKNGKLVEARQVAVNHVVVPSTGAVPNLTIAETAATTQITASTPRPSVVRSVGVHNLYGDSSGAWSGSAGFAYGGAPLYVNPAPAPTVGKMHYLVQWTGVAANPDDNYRYDLAFASDNGIPANEAYTAKTDQLATVRQSFYTDPTAGGSGYFADSPADPMMVAAHDLAQAASPQQMPATLIQYLGTADGDAWKQTETTPLPIVLSSPSHRFTAGQKYKIDWGHGPLAPEWGQLTGIGSPCDGCTSGTNLSLFVNRVSDSEPDHLWYLLPYKPHKFHVTVYRDNTIVYDKDDAPSISLTGIPQKPGTYRAVIDIDETNVPGFSQSVTSHTDVTFKYNPKPTPGNALPKGNICPDGSTDSSCQILPVISANHSVPR